MHISEGKMHDVNALDLSISETGDFYIMDRGYFDFARLYRWAHRLCVLCYQGQIQY